MPGPIPNRSEDLARPRERRGADQVEVKAGEMRSVTVPHADSDWHPIARKIWDGMKSSGQSDFFQNSDWAFAYSLMEDLSEYKKSSRRSGQMLQTIMASLGRLLLTEADRRQARIELSAPEVVVESAAIIAIADYRKDLGLEA